MNISFSIISIIGFLIISAFFSGSETAFFSLTKIQIKKIEKNNNQSSRRILRLLKNPRELLIIILLGNTIVNVAAASTAAYIAIEIGENYLQQFQSLLIIIEIFIMTILLLIFGEIAPKLLAFSSPEKTARSSSLILEIIKYLLWPIIKILELISSIFSVNKSKVEQTDITSEDFKNLIQSKITQHSLEENEKRIITSIFRFSSTDAKNIMTPRVDIAGVDTSEGLQKIKDVIISSGHSKIPIYKTNIDNIIGIIYAKDIILNPKKQSISSLLRPPLFVTENTKIQNLLNKFKKRKIQIAIIVDEYGGTEGLITLEDILEELVGEIRDEYDNEKPNIVKQNNDIFSINGMYSISELNEKFILDIDEDKYDNLAEFIYDNFNKVPEENESFIYKDLVKFTVKRIKARRIQYITLEVINNSNEQEI
ncbi:MAG: hemolysin family protein [Candidatus Tenebribacter burtonii]|nr:hemolysin family protein [Candidatus Tenebribacter burtonii]